MRTRKSILLILIFALVLNACSSNSFSNQVDLDGSAWVLIAINNNPAIKGNAPTLEFENDRVSGNASCNSYGGNYQVVGEKMNLGPLARTEMYCSSPEGVMEQEQTYLEILGTAERFELVDGVLTIYANSENTLSFQAANLVNPPTSTPPMMQPNQAQPTPTQELIATTPNPDFEPPVGFKEYQDPVVGVSIYIPAAWTVMGIVEGSYAIFLSYPEDKYVGGGAFEAGDTKCDLNIQPLNIQMSDIIQLWQDEPRTTIISEEEFRLQSRRFGQCFVIDSMGRATVFITELNQRVITLSCFGDFTIVDEIARTLNVRE